MLFPESLVQRQGRAFHALMEAWRLLDHDHDSSAQALARQPVWCQLLSQFALTFDEQAEVLSRVQRQLQDPAMRALMGLPIKGSMPVVAGELLIEREWLTPEGQVLRPDWVWVQPEQSVRVIDWKWSLLESEVHDYTQQLLAYASLMHHHFPTRAVEALILTSLGEIWRLEGQGLVHCQSAGRPAL
ncbi:MAG: hypothetical protein RL133_415 [Pseudomonadota bacterium]